MMTRANAAPALEPSPEAVKAARERLRENGIGASEDIVRDALRSVLAIEGARLDRRAREAAAAVLLRIQEATREALAVMVQPNAATTPMSAVPAAAARPRPQTPPQPPPPKRDLPVNLAEIVRSRLGDEVPAEEPSRPLAPPTPAPFRAPQPEPRQAEPRRPVFKRPRGR
jgi:hypothetical protein